MAFTAASRMLGGLWNGCQQQISPKRALGPSASGKHTPLCPQLNPAKEFILQAANGCPCSNAAAAAAGNYVLLARAVVGASASWILTTDNEYELNKCEDCPLGEAVRRAKAVAAVLVDAGAAECDPSEFLYQFDRPAHF
jgi:hypothetical protein